ncbi:hypothetical protein [uncultured Nostoc sp.]|uniref:hypothetical protein n=1 Tax=uncultured Nostoc sp. TaxID=340711 RepID=UPI00262099F7|nr:hypothetical protein [uncultured Nostoc sp.]
MPLLKNKEALKIQPLQIELTIRNYNNQPPPGLAAGSQKLVMVKPPRDDSDDLPRLKTGCKNFNLSRIKASALWHCPSSNRVQAYAIA